ncbi:hypothetical protein ACQR1I_32130 [Bradyrhizobium sp. HKCCYLS2038]|uniref:hypothetical protein n=1 Tax=unclassified Bradyrhizobium TaxID=2631580 RepID=UPI003EB76FBB
MAYLLEPNQYKWIQAAGAHPELLRKQINGVPLQQVDIPTETVLKGRLKLPDICSAGDAFRFVSDQGKVVLEELVPGCVSFFPLAIKATDLLLAGRRFFFIDVLPRGQLIDWDRSSTDLRDDRTKDGREVRFLRGLMTDPITKYKSVTLSTPPIWREIDVDGAAAQFIANKKHILLRDEVWEALNVKFPGQLVPRRLV